MLLAEVDDRLQDLILGLDRLRVGLVDALRRDHVDQLGGEVDVRFLDRPGLQDAQVARARSADERSARFEGLRPGVAAERLQPLRVAEARDLDLPRGTRLAVRVARVDDAVGLDLRADQLARRIAVLAEIGDAERRAVLGRLRDVEVDRVRRKDAATAVGGGARGIALGGGELVGVAAH